MAQNDSNLNMLRALGITPEQAALTAQQKLASHQPETQAEKKPIELIVDPLTKIKERIEADYNKIQQQAAKDQAAKDIARTQHIAAPGASNNKNPEKELVERFKSTLGSSAQHKLGA